MEIRRFDADVERRLREIARTIVEGMLRAFDLRGTREFWGSDRQIYFTHGTSSFSLLFSLLAGDDADEQIVARLDEAMRELTSGERCVSLGDDTLGHTWRDVLHLAVHPAGCDINTLTEVPDTVKLFGLERYNSYGLHELHPNTAAMIATAREEQQRDALQYKSRTRMLAYRKVLIARLQYLLQIRQDLTQEEIDLVKNAINQAQELPHSSSVDDLFAALAALGPLPDFRDIE